MLHEILLYIAFVMLPILLSSRVFIGLLSSWWNRYGYVPGMLIVTIIPTVVIFLLTIKLTERWFGGEEHSHTWMLALTALACGIVMALDAASRKARKNSRSGS